MPTLAEIGTGVGGFAKRARDAISPWNMFSGTDVASFLPGGGMVQASQEQFPAALKAYRAGDYGTAAREGLAGTLGTLGDVAWAAGPLMGATAGTALKAGSRAAAPEKVVNTLADLGGAGTYRVFKGYHPYTGGPVTDWKGNVLSQEPEKLITEFASPGGEYAGFFSSKPEVANRFAAALSRNGGAVFSGDLTLKNPFVIDAGGKPAAHFQFTGPGLGTAADVKTYRDALKDPQYDGVIIKNTKDEGDVFVPKPSNQPIPRFGKPQT